jgi:hypothetical protein
MTELRPNLPPTFAATRESLRALAAYVIAPYRKARTGRIGLRATGDGFGTPPLPDGSRVLVRADQLVLEPTAGATISTLEAAATFLDAPLSSDPGVGADLPPFDPGRPLDVDPDASLALGGWYALADASLAGLRATEPSTTEAQLWPEHFDLAVQVEALQMNVGFSPGDSFSAEPYVYVGPFDMAGLSAPYWNVSFGAMLTYSDLVSGSSPQRVAGTFIAEGVRLQRERLAG